MDEEQPQASLPLAEVLRAAREQHERLRQRFMFTCTSLLIHSANINASRSCLLEGVANAFE